MSLEVSRIDAIIQYALLTAGEEDLPIDRQLGPIHLIKYVYLADLEYATANRGVIFTGIRWKFYKFGPWANIANDRIEPCLFAIRAEKKLLESKFEDRAEWARWCLTNEPLLRTTERELPPVITGSVKRYVHKFGQDTAELLHFVYNTKPMLAAAPNDYLDFSCVVEDQEHGGSVPRTPRSSKEPTVSAKQMKKFNERMGAIRHKRTEQKSNKVNLVTLVSKPRYDEVYEAGIAWLEELAGDPIPAGERTVEFDEDVWRSATRKGEDVP